MVRFWPIDKKNFFFLKKRLSKFEIMRRRKKTAIVSLKNIILYIQRRTD